MLLGLVRILWLSRLTRQMYGGGGLEGEFSCLYVLRGQLLFVHMRNSTIYLLNASPSFVYFSCSNGQAIVSRRPDSGCVRMTDAILYPIQIPTLYDTWQ